jgi:CheY-like chemotaxis protein
MTPIEKEPSNETSNPGRGLGEALRVVIADDDHDAVLVLSALFRDKGYETKGVYQGDQVVAAVVEFGADAALIDLMMPGMTGLDVARELRQRFATRTPLLVAVTGWTTPADRVLARVAGFDEHVGKPYDPAELLSLVDERIKERRANQSRSTPPIMALGAGVHTLHSRLLRKLAEVLGGIEPVRRALMVPTADMARWLAGAEQMPRAVFIRATDLLIQSTPAPNGAPNPQPGNRGPGPADEDSSG